MPSANDYAPTVPLWCAVLAVLHTSPSPLTLGAIGAEVSKRRRSHDVWRSRVERALTHLVRDEAVRVVTVQYSPRRTLRAYELTPAGRALFADAADEVRSMLGLADSTTRVPGRVS